MPDPQQAEAQSAPPTAGVQDYAWEGHVIRVANGKPAQIRTADSHATVAAISDQKIFRPPGRPENPIELKQSLARFAEALATGHAPAPTEVTLGMLADPSVQQNRGPGGSVPSPQVPSTQVPNARAPEGQTSAAHPGTSAARPNEIHRDALGSIHMHYDDFPRPGTTSDYTVAVSADGTPNRFSSVLKDNGITIESHGTVANGVPHIDVITLAEHGTTVRVRPGVSRDRQQYGALINDVETSAGTAISAAEAYAHAAPAAAPSRGNYQ
ncbi:MAG: hypothetical protein M3N08_09095, partial [Pseudomonadota bacterium]|nr:hypothetical protein [Pseudomonadota bacterium]